MYNIILMVSWQQEDKYIVKEKKPQFERGKNRGCWIRNDNFW